ncbi:MAG: TolC family protein [Planctomycetes bacterium]|nr:TolC family protein [Planctomycetota bacterium]
MFFAAVVLFVASLPQDATVPSTGALQLRLDDALRTALENDLSLKIEDVAIDIAELEFRRGWGAFDPIARATAGYTNSERPNTQPFLPVSSIDSEVYSFGAGVNLPLLTGGSFDASVQQDTQTTNVSVFPTSVSDTLALSFNQPLLRGAWYEYKTSGLRESGKRYMAQIERAQQARQDLLKRVEDAYWDLVAAGEQLRVAEETLALGREQLEQNRRRLDAGVGTEVEVLQAETNVAQRIEQRLAREVSVRGAADRLKGLMYPGTDPAKWDLEITPVSSLPAVKPENIPNWGAALAIALTARPELKRQAFEIEAVEEQLVRATSDRRPTLDFSLSTSSSAVDGGEWDALRDAASWDFPTYQASLSFSSPTMNIAALAAERSARAAMRSARLVYDQIESQIVEEVRAAVRNTQYSIEAVRAANASTELARRQLAAEQARFREGLSTNFQVLEFQQQLAESLYSQTLARANLAKALTALEKAQGTLDVEPR